MKKLKDKHLDMIVVNDLLRSGSGFGVDTNAVTIIDRTGKRTEVPTLPKTQIVVNSSNYLLLLTTLKLNFYCM